MDGKTLIFRVLLAVVAGGGLGAYLYLGRDYYWGHAAISALAVVALVYTSFRSYDNLRKTYRR